MKNKAWSHCRNCWQKMSNDNSVAMHEAPLTRKLLSFKMVNFLCKHCMVKS